MLKTKCQHFQKPPIRFAVLKTDSPNFYSNAEWSLFENITSSTCHKTSYSLHWSCIRNIVSIVLYCIWKTRNMACCDLCNDRYHNTTVWDNKTYLNSAFASIAKFPRGKNCMTLSFVIFWLCNFVVLLAAGFPPWQKLAFLANRPTRASQDLHSENCFFDPCKFLNCPTQASQALHNDKTCAFFFFCFLHTKTGQSRVAGLL